MQYRLLLFITPLVPALATACYQSQTAPGNRAISAATPQPQAMLDAPEIPLIDFLKQQDQVEKESHSPLVRAWKRVPGYDHYRLARAPDFKIPEWVEKEIDGRDIERAISYPYESGEMSGAEGLSVIIIDKTISDLKRFSCVVFISRPANRYDLYWIFKNEDLSHFTMGRHSGDVYLLELRDDKTRHLCDIQYSRRQRRWACDFY